MSELITHHMDCPFRSKKKKSLDSITGKKKKETPDWEQKLEEKPVPRSCVFLCLNQTPAKDWERGAFRECKQGRDPDSLAPERKPQFEHLTKHSETEQNPGLQMYTSTTSAFAQCFAFQPPLMLITHFIQLYRLCDIMVLKFD